MKDRSPIKNYTNNLILYIYMETWPGIAQRCFTEKDILILSLHLGDRVKRLNNLNSNFRESIFQGVFGKDSKELGCIAEKNKIQQ